MQVAETPAIYSNKVLPYIQSLPASRITWVYNILQKKVNAAANPSMLIYALLLAQSAAAISSSHQ